MAEENEAASKTEEPTPRKLEEARKKGDVVKTPDLSALASLAAAATVVALTGGWMSRNMVQALVPFLASPDAMSFTGGGGIDIARHAMLAAAPLLLAVVLAAAAAGVAGNLVQTGLMFTPEKLAFDFKKVSPAAGFKRIFGLDGLMQFLKSLVKVLLTAALAYWVLKPHLNDLYNLAQLEPGAM
ncbi:MAG: EscU/YscU/HrcU family type III secretion system export apparatus switch protein, partial [Phenylobacterium sp.]